MKDGKKAEVLHFEELGESIDYKHFYYHPYMLKKMLGDGHVFQISVFLDQGLEFYSKGIYNPELSRVCTYPEANHVLTLIGYDDNEGYWILLDSNVKGNSDDTLWFKQKVNMFNQSSVRCFCGSKKNNCQIFTYEL